jgi:hypothetical protein
MIFSVKEPSLLALLLSLSASLEEHCHRKRIDFLVALILTNQSESPVESPSKRRGTVWPVRWSSWSASPIVWDWWWFHRMIDPLNNLLVAMRRHTILVVLLSKWDMLPILTWATICCSRQDLTWKNYCQLWYYNRMLMGHMAASLWCWRRINDLVASKVEDCSMFVAGEKLLLS